MAPTQQKLIATETLYVGTDRAHNVGDEVPEENVARNGWEGKVAPAESRAAVAAVEEAGGYDPAAHTVDEVLAYIEENPGERDAVLTAEAHGKGRTGILGS